MLLLLLIMLLLRLVERCLPILQHLLQALPLLLVLSYSLLLLTPQPGPASASDAVARAATSQVIKKNA
jgi:hypothetical protein